MIEIETIDKNTVGWNAHGFVFHLRVEPGDGNTAMYSYRLRDLRSQKNLWDTFLFESTGICTGWSGSEDNKRELVLHVLRCLSVGPQDTYPGHFEAYTGAQLEWRDSSRRPLLALLVMEDA